MSKNKVIIEAAINGPWSRRLQPNIPLSPAEIVREAVQCAKAGASIIHFHAYDPATEEQITDFDVICNIVKEIQSQTNAIVYPAIRYMSNYDSIQENSGPMRYEHLANMASKKLLEWLIVDPGCTNLITYDDITKGEMGRADINTPAAIHWALQIASKYNLHPGFAVYEPGYLRLAAALTRIIPGIPTPMFRFVFSDQFTFGYKPREYALRAYLSLLNEEAPGSPWMVAGLGVDISHLIPIAVESAGHIRVGLEDAHLGVKMSNLRLLEDAVNRVYAAGGSVATAAEMRSEILKQNGGCNSCSVSGS